MTREKAIEQAKELLEEATRCENSVSYVTSDDEEWLKMAIKALEQESTAKENLVVEDCISRAELLKAVDTWDKFGCDADTKLVPIKDCYVPYIHYDDVVKAIKGMPSVQPKTGHWIHGRCSECGKDGLLESTGEYVCNATFVYRIAYSKYCPNCGAKMLPTDSEKE